MFTIKLSTPFPNWPFARQTPGSLGKWRNCQFVIDQPVDRCDAWVVFADLGQPETTLCPPDNTLFMANEPEEVHLYAPKFLQQFSRILTCQSRIRHPGAIRDQPGCPWHVGIIRGPETPVLQYDDFTSVKTANKTGLISIVCSNKTFTHGHRLRLEFTRRLQAHFGDRIGVFGSGFTPIDDKWKAVYPYRYHVVIENGCVPDCWTEKLADSYLGFCFPFYWGCPNLNEYFPQDAFMSIDIEEPLRAIAQIETAIKEDLYSQRQEIIEEARCRVLDRFNLFELLTKHLLDRPRTSPELVHLRPEDQFPAALTWRRAARWPFAAASAIWRGLRNS